MEFVSPVSDESKRADSKELAKLLAEADTLLWSGASQKAISLLDGAAGMDITKVERYTIGTTLLRASNCRLGWDLYDLHPSRTVDRLRGVPRWDGRPCRRLIILAEQGFGDALQFIRFVPLVSDRAETIVVAIHDALFDVVSGSPLLEKNAVITKSTARETRWSPDTRYERLLSLPAKIPAPEVKAAKPYLRLPGAGVTRVLPSASAGTITVGVAWRTTYRRGCPNRSFPVRHVRELTANGQVRIVPLHRTRDMRAVPGGAEIVQIDNFLETAEVMSQCDYVVTADTVTAHLAAALGVPTLICFLRRPDWRWGTPDNPTRWYVNAEMLFQGASEDWRPVLAAASRRVTEGTRREEP